MPLSAASARAVSKHFGATRALDNVHFDVLAGEVHTLVGENDAGKSTLVRVLGGVHRPELGRDRDPRTGLPLQRPARCHRGRVITIPQELRLVPALSIAENLMTSLANIPPGSMFECLFAHFGFLVTPGQRAWFSPSTGVGERSSAASRACRAPMVAVLRAVSVPAFGQYSSHVRSAGSRARSRAHRRWLAHNVQRR